MAEQLETVDNDLDTKVTSADMAKNEEAVTVVADKLVNQLTGDAKSRIMTANPVLATAVDKRKRATAAKPVAADKLELAA